MKSLDIIKKTYTVLLEQGKLLQNSIRPKPGLLCAVRQAQVLDIKV